MENYLAKNFATKWSITPPMQSSHFSLGIYPRENKNLYPLKVLCRMFIVALLIVAKKGNNSNVQYQQIMAYSYNKIPSA